MEKTFCVNAKFDVTFLLNADNKDEAIKKAYSFLQKREQEIKSIAKTLHFMILQKTGNSLITNFYCDCASDINCKFFIEKIRKRIDDLYAISTDSQFILGELMKEFHHQILLTAREEIEKENKRLLIDDFWNFLNTPVKVKLFEKKESCIVYIDSKNVVRAITDNQ